MDTSASVPDILRTPLTSKLHMTLLLDTGLILILELELVDIQLWFMNTMPLMKLARNYSMKPNIS